MAYLFRIAFVLLFLFLISGGVRASEQPPIPAGTDLGAAEIWYQYRVPGVPLCPQTTHFPSVAAVAACEVSEFMSTYVGNFPTYGAYSENVNEFAGTYDMRSCSAGGSTPTFCNNPPTNFAINHYAATKFTNCPVGSSANINGRCIQTNLGCPSGFNLLGGESGTTCSDVAHANGTCTAGGIEQLAVDYVPGSLAPAQPCLDGCKYNYQQASNQFQKGGKQKWYGTAVSTGTTCNADTGIGAPTTTCPTGQVPGTINGNTVCFGASASNPFVTVTNSSSTNGDTTSNKVINTGGGIPPVVQTTTTPNGGTSTTVTSSDPNSTKPSDMAKFCADNPSSPMCKTSSFGGSCNSAFVCDGDAIQCAISREMYARDCSFFDAASTEKTLYQNIVAGADPLAGTLPSGANATSTAFPSAIDQTAFLNSSGCLQDSDFNLGGTFGTLTIPFSRMCSTLQFLGQIAVVFALVAAARIAFGG